MLCALWLAASRRAALAALALACAAHLSLHAVLLLVRSICCYYVGASTFSFPCS